MSPQDKAPAYFWYVRDFMSDEAVALMSYEQQGIYRALLDRQWLEGSIPADPSQIAAILRISRAKFVKVWPRISAKFSQISDGRLANARMERERQKAEEFREISSKNGRKGAEARWHRHSDGNGPANGPAIDSPLAKNGSSSASSSSPASSSATAFKSVERARPRGVMGGSYASLSNIAYSYRGHALNRGPHYDAFVERFDGDREAFRRWLDGEIDACYAAGGAPGKIFGFIDERWEKKSTLTTNKTAGNIAALQEFVRKGAAK